MKQPRDYQLLVKDHTINKIKSGTKSLIQCMATGMGKTASAGFTIKELPGRTLWLTHTEELIEQSALPVFLEMSGNYHEIDAIKSHGGIIGTLNYLDKAGLFGLGLENPLAFRKTIGVIKQERFDLNAKICVASIQTIFRRLHKIDPDHFSTIVIDECHLAMAKSFLTTLDHFPDAVKIGLTATPERLDGASLGDIFEEFACNYDIKYGVDNGWLVPITGHRISTRIDLSKVKTLGGDFSKSDIEKVINTPERNRKVVQAYQERCDGKQFIAFAVDVNHCMELCKAFNEAGINTGFVVGDEKLCPNRKEIIEQFRNKELTGLVNVTILTAGFDHDGVECIIHARPTQSKTIYLQATGRGTRILKGVIDGIDDPAERVKAIQLSQKPRLHLIDIVDNTTRHNLINAWTLERGKAAKDKVFISEEERQKLLDAETARATKLEHDLEFDETVQLIDIPELELWNKGRNLEPATEAQLFYLRKWGYDTDKNIYTKFDASQIFAQRPASREQIAQMRAWGYNTNMGMVTVGNYNACRQQRLKMAAKVDVSKLNFHKVPISGLR